MTDQVAQDPIAGSGIAGTLLRDAPVVVVTAPVGPQAAPTVTVTWTYVSTLSKPQATYRVRILNQFGTATLFDSGAVLSAAVSYACPFVLSGGSSYIVRVTCSDGTESGEDDSAFSSDQNALAAFSVELDVGSVYEVGINGIGYMLSDTPQRPYKRSTGTLQAPRFATGETSFSEAVERYTFAGSGDWTFGAGQRMGSRVSSDGRAFWDSELVDPFTPGELTLLNTTTQQVASALATQAAVVASDVLYVHTNTDEMKYVTAVGGGTTTMSAVTGGTIVSLASDGVNYYVSSAARTIRKSKTSTPGAVWSDLSAQTTAIALMEWASDRLAVAYVNGTGQACLSTLTDAGAEEVAGGRWKHSAATIGAITAGDGYLWYSVNKVDRCDVYAWQLGSSSASFIALTLPQGERVTALSFYLGNVMVRTAEVVDGTTTRAYIYRAVPSAGELTPERVATLEESGVDHKLGDFLGSGRFVLFSWKAMATDNRSGVGCVDLSTGGYARWIHAPVDTAVGAVNTLFNWFGKPGFTVGAYGAVIETATPAAAGYLTSSILDLGSGLTKVTDRVALVTEPLPATVAVDVDLSFDDGNSFVEYGAISTAGLKGGDWEVGIESKALVMKLRLSSTGAFTPVVRLVQAKQHPLSIIDTVLELPVNCHDKLVGLNGVTISDSTPIGMARARALEALIGTRVLLQDIDWPFTQTSEVWEVVSAEYSATGTFSRQLSRRVEQDPVCVVTLRRGQ